MRAIKGKRKTLDEARAARTSGRHDPADYIIKAEDHNGQSARVWCRVAPQVDRAIDIISGEKKFPFRTKGDMIRWAIVEGVRILSMVEPDDMVNSVMRQHDAIMNMLRAEQDNSNFISYSRTLTEVVGNFLQTKATSEARRVVAAIKADITAMPDGHWRDRYLQELEDKFGYLIDSRHASGAGIGDGHVDGPVDEDDE